jgi:hypothetical protein
MIFARFMRTVLTLGILGSLAVATPALAAFGLDWNVPDQGAVAEIGLLQSFHSTLTNTGDEFDTFTVTMVKAIPEEWVGSICVGETCYPPFQTTVEVPLGAGDSAFLDIDITPNVVTGEGYCAVTVTSAGNPSIRPSYNFSVVSTGLEVLVVTDDTTPSLAPYITDVLDTTDKTYGVWKKVEMGGLSNLELDNFSTVIWSAGELSGGLNDEDRAALAYFVQHGGNLFLSGRDLAYEACDSGSPYYSAASKSWFNMILGTDHTGAVPSMFTEVQGVAGDPFTSSLLLGISGGDGADNTVQTLDGVTPIGTGLPSLRYYNAGAGETAAVRSQYGDGMTYFCAFAFEAINSAAGRESLLGGALDWFDGLLIPVNDDIVRPLLVKAPYAAPNPFNPQTSIKFEVGGERNVPAEVTIYDLKGQVVRRLFSGQVTPGLQDFVWNGRFDDGRNASTGVYLAQVRIDGTTREHVKMTLVK